MSNEHLEHEVSQLVYRLEELEARQDAPDRDSNWRSATEQLQADMRELRLAVIELGRLTRRNTDSIEDMVMASA